MLFLTRFASLSAEQTALFRSGPQLSEDGHSFAGQDTAASRILRGGLRRAPALVSQRKKLVGREYKVEWAVCVHEPLGSTRCSSEQ